MASIGKVVSTAISGGDAPYVQAPDREARVFEKTVKTSDEVTALRGEVGELKNLLAAFLAAQTAPATGAVEPEKELTAGEKAAKTRAENKAKAEAEAKAGE